ELETIRDGAPTSGATTCVVSEIAWRTPPRTTFEGSPGATGRQPRMLWSTVALYILLENGLSPPMEWSSTPGSVPSRTSRLSQDVQPEHASARTSANAPR